MQNSFLSHFLFLSEAPAVVLYALFFAIIFSCVWLWFWLREDEHPEPIKLIILAFLAGAIIVPFVVPLQQFAADLYPFNPGIRTFAWAVVEEVYKYGIALILLLWRRDVDEPIDFVMYMIVIAIGFSTAENALYMYKSAYELIGSADTSIFTNMSVLREFFVTGTLRFIGASLTHIISSATIGVAVALVFFRNNTVRVLAGIVGLSTAIGLHTAFNLSILYVMSNTGGAVASSGVGIVFLTVWIISIVLLLFLEKVKRIHQ